MSSITYGVDDVPPFRITWLNALQHISLSAVTLVFPRIVPLEQIGLRAGMAIGDLRAATIVLPDPVRPIGVRDYRTGDSPRQIHWKASARRGSIEGSRSSRLIASSSGRGSASRLIQPARCASQSKKRQR